MRALLRKDAFWMLTMAVDGMVIGLVAMTSVSNGAGVWYRPDDKFGPGSLVFFWIAAGYDSQTALFGLLHGVGYLGLCALIFWAVMRREAPWPLFAATLTPVGPFGTVIGIELIERRGWGVEGPNGVLRQDG